MIIPDMALIYQLISQVKSNMQEADAFYIVTSQAELRDCDRSNERRVMCKNKQYCQ